MLNRIFLFLVLINANNCYSQCTNYPKEQIVIAFSCDSLFDKYIYQEAVIDKKDTVIVLIKKEEHAYYLKNDLINLEKLYSITIDEEIGFRLYEKNIYIDGKLVFPKEKSVYIFKPK